MLCAPSYPSRTRRPSLSKSSKRSQRAILVSKTTIYSLTRPSITQMAPHSNSYGRVPASFFMRPSTVYAEHPPIVTISPVAKEERPKRVDKPIVADSPVTIPGLRDAIHDIDSQMASLISQREKLETHLQQAVSSQTPVLRLPSELLSSIFIMGVMGNEDLISTLMLVCRYWAEVALRTHVLWSNIVVSPHDPLSKALRKLERSGSVPLDITINFSPPPFEIATGVMERVVHAMDVISPALWRTRSLILSVPNRAQAHAALLRCQEDAPLLEVLSVRISHSMQDDQQASLRLPLFNGHTPRLRSCSFTSFNFGWDIATVSHLRVLKLGGYWNGLTPSVDTLLNILQACPQLEEFALRNMSDVDWNSCSSAEEDLHHHPLRIVQLPRLSKASFHCSGATRTRMLLRQMSFPALESLELCHLDNLTPILEQLKVQSLTSLPLRFLRLESSFFDEFALEKLLRRLTSLVTLEVVDVEDASSNLLESLSAPSIALSWICPKLESLNLEGCTAIDWDSLRSLIESRLPNRSQRKQSHSSNPPSNILMPVPVSSASAYARMRSTTAPHPIAPIALAQPTRLRAIDVTRCHQISREMVKWLKMYVTDVRCEPGKSVWGEHQLS